MSRKQHPLIIYWDTETENGFTGLSCASQFCYTHNDIDSDAYLYEGFNCIEETFTHIFKLWESLKRPKVRLYAHNAAYDLMRIKYQDSRIAVKVALVAGSMVAGVMHFDELTIEVRDSMRLLPDSLKKLASSLCPHLPKMDMNHLEGYEIGNEEHQEYAKRDVLSLRGVIQGFCKITGIKINDLKLTAAGQAFYLVKKKYEERYGKYKASSRDFNELILKNYYYGGRIYIRQNHNPLALYNTTSLDITSSYPKQMESQLFPLAGIKPTIQTWIPHKKGRFFVECEVTDYYPALPILPTRDDKGNVIYPQGTFRTHISDTEYYFIEKYQPEYFKNNLKVVNCIFWGIEKCAQWLKPYVDKYYGLKEEGDVKNKNEKGSGDALRTVGKLFLNSPYGKFAQKYVDDENAISWNGGEQLQVFKASDNDHRNAHISAFITGGARVYLYEAIMHYGEQNVIYSDTDSIKVKTDVYQTMTKMVLEGDYLGSWKPEGEYNDLQVIAPKVYIGKHLENGKSKLEIKAKGLPVNDITSVTVNGVRTEYKRCYSDETNKKLDNLACELIAKNAKSLATIEVGYTAKPNKLKTFIATGQFASLTTKTMSSPDKVTGMKWDGMVYKYHILSETFDKAG